MAELRASKKTTDLFFVFNQIYNITKTCVLKRYPIQ